MVTSLEERSILRGLHMVKLTIKRSAVMVVVVLSILICAIAMPSSAQVAPAPSPGSPPPVFYSTNSGQTVSMPRGTTFYIFLPSINGYLGRIGITGGLRILNSVRSNGNNLYEIQARTRGAATIRALYVPNVVPRVTRTFTIRMNVV